MRLAAQPAPIIEGDPVSETETEQALFWKGDFGDQYISRNQSPEFLASNVHFFAKILASAGSEIGSVLELGSNIGMNYLALRQLIPKLSYSAVEINPTAVKELRALGVDVFPSSIEDFEADSCWDLVFTKTVLIHLHPEYLDATYEKMTRMASRFVLVAEYFNPVAVSVDYRGEEERLFKRDFAGEILDRFPSMRLKDYGFSYNRGPFPQDNISWFLLEKS